MTPLALELAAGDAARLPGQLAQLRASGAELVELRAARPDPELLAAALAGRGRLRLIAALVPGAAAAASEAELLRFFAPALAGGIEFIELELADWERCPRLREALRGELARGAGRLILACEADGASGGRAGALARLRAVPEAAVLRVGWRAHGLLDGLEALARMLERWPGDARPLLAEARGEQGQLSRLLAAKFGAPFALARADGGPASAAAVPLAAELRELYRWDSQRPASAVFGVIGWPVAHSLSPAIHGAGFAACGFDGIYVPLPVQPTREACFAALDALREFAPLRFRGASVTLPHKQHALEYVQARGGALEELSAHIGAINTLLVRPDGSLEGLNSDYLGALSAITAALGIDAAGLRGMRVSVLGAGGAAAAIVAGLARSGASTTVYNRSLQRAAALAKRFDGTPGTVNAAAWDALRDARAELYVNCTPIGMHPHADASPLPEELPLGPGAAVFDTIYNPLETRLLRRARSCGAVAIGGLEMFVAQAAVQFERFCGAPAPLELFRRVVRQRLAA